MTPAAPDGWREHNLGDASVILDNQRVPLSGAQRAGRSGPFPYCGANGVLDHIDDYVIDDDVVLLAEDGGNFDQWRTRPIAYRMTGKIWVNNHAHVLKATKAGDTGFLFYSLEHRDITTFISSGTRSKLTRGELVRIEVLMPEALSEQRSIARVLSDADDMIASLERLIAKKLAIKQGMMQQLLTGRTRLPGFSANWSHQKLVALATMSSGGTPPASVNDYYGGGIPWVSISDMTKGGKYISQTERTLSDTGLRSSSAKLYEPNVVLYAMYASLGECSLAVGRVASSQAILGIETGPELEREYLYYWLQHAKSAVKLLGQQGTQSNLNAGMVRAFTLHLPPRDEQVAIASVLMDIDCELEQMSRRIDKARDIKTGMMQQLLTGRVRLPADTES